MECVEARNLIDSYLNRTISDHDCAEFISHVRGCRDCFEELEIYLAISETLNDNGEPGERDYNYDRKIAKDLDKMEDYLKSQRYQQIAARILLSLAFILMVVLLYLGLNSEPEEVLPAWETEMISEEVTETSSESVAEMLVESEYIAETSAD